jgi:hypothetical protein
MFVEDDDCDDAGELRPEHLFLKGKLGHCFLPCQKYWT